MNVIDFIQIVFQLVCNVNLKQPGVNWEKTTSTGSIMLVRGRGCERLPWEMIDVWGFSPLWQHDPKKKKIHYSKNWSSQHQNQWKELSTTQSSLRICELGDSIQQLSQSYADNENTKMRTPHRHQKKYSKRQQRNPCHWQSHPGWAEYRTCIISETSSVRDLQTPPLHMVLLPLKCNWMGYSISIKTGRKTKALCSFPDIRWCYQDVELSCK